MSSAYGGMLPKVTRCYRDEDHDCSDLGEHDRGIEVGRLLYADHQNGRHAGDRNECEDVEHRSHMRQGIGIDVGGLQSWQQNVERCPLLLVEDQDAAWVVRPIRGVLRLHRI